MSVYNVLSGFWRLLSETLQKLWLKTLPKFVECLQNNLILCVYGLNYISKSFMAYENKVTQFKKEGFEAATLSCLKKRQSYEIFTFRSS